jgi:hypothetical protein
VLELPKVFLITGLDYFFTFRALYLQGLNLECNLIDFFLSDVYLLVGTLSFEVFVQEEFLDLIAI